MKRWLGWAGLCSTLLGCATRPQPPRVFAKRLLPGQDLRRELATWAQQENLSAAFVVSGVGSLAEVTIRFASQDKGTRLKGPFEIVSLTGTVSKNGVHVHIAVADSQGRTQGGHLVEGSKVHTTVELALQDAPDLSFTRAKDPQTGYEELVIERRGDVH